MKKKSILVTGAAGFIGFNVVKKILNYDFIIVGLDNINDYYSVKLKHDRLIQLGIVNHDLISNLEYQSRLFNNFVFYKTDLTDFKFVENLFIKFQFDYVIHLAAQAGVRYSIDNPRAYTSSNIDGFLTILESSKTINLKHLIFASSSSVYGLNDSMPLHENMVTDYPVSLYAATKKANEVMAHSYSHLYKIPVTGLRFFTVYGPWGRPDMALFTYVNSIINNNSIKIFNNGQMTRDFTYIDDIVESIYLLLENPPTKNLFFKNNQIENNVAPFQLFNIGNSNPVSLIDYINEIEVNLDKTAIKEYLPMQKGDVVNTHADITKLKNYINYKPKIEIKDGINSFISWYKLYYKI